MKGMEIKADAIADIKGWKKAANKIVFTNGCFDLLHPGHISLLKGAKDLGDKLIVGVNSDSSVKRLKGENRPVFSLEERVTVLSSLACVDLVIPFDQDTPEELIKVIVPDILVKGGDYQNKNIVGSKFVLKNGGLIKTIKFEQGYSTTEIIRKIKRL